MIDSTEDYLKFFQQIHEQFDIKHPRKILLFIRKWANNVDEQIRYVTPAEHAEEVSKQIKTLSLDTPPNSAGIRKSITPATPTTPFARTFPLYENGVKIVIHPSVDILRWVSRLFHRVDVTFLRTLLESVEDAGRWDLLCATAFILFDREKVLKSAKEYIKVIPAIRSFVAESKRYNHSRVFVS